jgi:hypothetical protein
MRSFIVRLKPADVFLYIWYGALAALVAYVLLTWQFSLEQPYQGAMFYTYGQILAGKQPAPFKYRYFAYLLPEIIRLVTGKSLQLAEAFNRAFWLWASAVALHAYVSYWFKRTGAIVATLALFGIASLIVVQTSFEPTDLPTFCLLILSLLALQRRRYQWLLLFIPFGLLFRETMLFFFPVWGLYFLFESDKRLQLPYLLGALGLAAVVFFGLRWYFGFESYNPYTLPRNLGDDRWPVRVLLLFNVFLIIPWFTFKNAPRLMKYSAVLVPIVFALNLLFAFAKDARLWLPLVPILVPLGLLGLLPNEVISNQSPTPVVNN